MRTYKLKIGDSAFTIAVKRFSGGTVELEVDGTPYTVTVEEIHSEADAPGPMKPPAQALRAPRPAAGREAGSVTAPIPGQILEVFVSEGDSVTDGQPVLKMEAMKMETVIHAAKGGTVAAVRVHAGDAVTQGQELMVIG